MAIKSHGVNEAPKKATNPKKLQPGVSRTPAAGVDRAIDQGCAESWLKENLEALQSSNDYVERNGLPLEKHRLF